MGEAFHLKAKSVLRYFKIRVTFTVFILWIQRINWETHLIFFCQKFGVPEKLTVYKTVIYYISMKIEVALTA